MEKLKIMVCGTSFGRFYLKGIKRLSEYYELAGIFSTGSVQSKKIADELQVPLYTNINDITKEKIDVACVVVRSSIVGGKGTDIAVQLLEKGIHIIQEQPIHYKDMIICYKKANENNCQYIVNTFYPYLKTVEKFLSLSRDIMQKTKMVFVDASCSLQVLFPMIDIMGRMLNGFTPWKIDEKSICHCGMFSWFAGELKGIPFQFKIQNQLNGDNPDNYFYLMHRIILYTDSGSLTLSETHGEIIWTPRYMILRDENGVLEPYIDEHLLTLPISELVYSSKNMTIKEMYEDEWPNGIKYFLSQSYDILISNQSNPKVKQQSLTYAKIWNDIGQVIGASKQAEAAPFKSFSLRELLADNKELLGGLE